MSKNSRFNEDFSYIMLIISLLTVFSLLFVKLIYLLALPYYKVITNLFSEKVSQSEAQKFKYWMRFLPVGWFVDINSIEDNKRIKNASVTLSFFTNSTYCVINYCSINLWCFFRLNNMGDFIYFSVFYNR